jgi:prophage regulatory protein
MQIFENQSRDHFLRLKDVLQLFPVSRSAWYKGVEEGRYPKGVKLSERTIAWRRSDIDALIEGVSSGAGSETPASRVAQEKPRSRRRKTQAHQLPLDV